MTASHGPIYACPECAAALIEWEEGLWCPVDDVVYTWAEIAGDL